METTMHTLTFDGVTKRFGPVVALDGFSAEVRPGRVTAFIGANGSGKTTSMRVLLGLATADAGVALVGDRTYRELEYPLRTVGAVLDQGVHPNRSARNHVRLAARSAGVPARRADEVLALVGLDAVAGRRAGGFSLGMKQRLALATALVGDPGVLVMDEPFNGLDPDGIVTLRTFLRSFADHGGTVLLSSHLLAEVSSSADDAIVIDHGHLVIAGPVTDLVDSTGSLESTYRTLTHASGRAWS
jgi:ABC-2 type transport system ATP-binding protein